MNAFSCSTLEVSDHSCTQNTGKISAPEIGNSTPAPVNLVFHSRDLGEKGHALQTGCISRQDDSCKIR